MLGRLQQRRIKRAKKEQLVFQSWNRPAQFAGNVGCGVVNQTAEWISQIEIVWIEPCRLKLVRLPVAADGPMILVSTRLGHDLDNTTRGTAVLRLDTAGLNLDFLDEGKVDAGTQGTVHAGVNAK